MDLSEEAIKYLKDNKKLLINKYANPEIYKPTKFPISIFMAGSPGAGKTEFYKLFVNFLEDQINYNRSEKDFKMLRIDADEIREILPGYDGTNSFLFQGAISIGVSKLYDYVLKKGISALLDSTFSSEKYAI